MIQQAEAVLFSKKKSCHDFKILWGCDIIMMLSEIKLNFGGAKKCLAW